MRLATVDDWLPLRLRIGGIFFGVRYLIKRREMPQSWRPPDIYKATTYRREYFGGPAVAALQTVLRRRDSEWEIGERELFAAFVSALNQCPF